MDDELRSLRQELRQLRQDLNAYHEVNEASTEHDREFLLGASWGVIKGINGIASIAGPTILVNALKIDNWLIGAAVWLAAFFAVVYFLQRGVETGFEGDRKKLSNRAKWEKMRSSDLWS